MIRAESIFGKAHQKTGLSDGGISDEDKLNELIVVFGSAQCTCLRVATNALSIVYHTVFYLFLMCSAMNCV